MSSNQNLRVSWKNLYLIIMRTILQERGTIYCNIIIWYTNFHVPQALKIPAAKAAVDKTWEKLEKILAWDLTKVRSKSEVIDEARTQGAKVHFASLMDICHLKNAELEAKHQKYKGRVVLRGDIVKDESGSNAIFTKQGSSASQMTAAKIMDIIASQSARVRWTRSGRNICLYPGKKMEDAPKSLKNTKIGMSRRLDSSTTTQKWPKSWSNMEDPVVPLERYLYGHPSAGLLWERQFEKKWEKASNRECLFVNRARGVFLKVYVVDKKIG